MCVTDSFTISLCVPCYASWGNQQATKAIRFLARGFDQLSLVAAYSVGNILPVEFWQLLERHGRHSIQQLLMNNLQLAETPNSVAQRLYTNQDMTFLLLLLGSVVGRPRQETFPCRQCFYN